jgi:hypothetical protein
LSSRFDAEPLLGGQIIIRISRQITKCKTVALFKMTLFLFIGVSVDIIFQHGVSFYQTIKQSERIILSAQKLLRELGNPRYRVSMFRPAGVH